MSGLDARGEQCLTAGTADECAAKMVSCGGAGRDAVVEGVRGFTLLPAAAPDSPVSDRGLGSAAPGPGDGGPGATCANGCSALHYAPAKCWILCACVLHGHSGLLMISLFPRDSPLNAALAPFVWLLFAAAVL